MLLFLTLVLATRVLFPGDLIFVKHSFIRFLTIVAIFSLTTLGFAQSPVSTAKNEGGKTADAGRKPASRPATPAVIQDEMKEALALIQNNYVGAKSLDYNEVFKSSIDSMLHSLDPHSNYYDAKEFEQFRNDQSSRYFGIGATIGDLSDADGKVLATYIRATFDGAPANRAGLRYGDKIIEVNGVQMLGKPYSEVRNHLRGPQGTTAKITVERLGTGARETMNIVRDAVPQPSISEVYMIRPGVGYLNMDGGFNQTTYNEFVIAMRQLRAAGMQQVVIDLRNNGGGLVSQAYRVANSFLSEGQIVFSQKGRMEGATDPPYRAMNRTPDRSPVVMLVNRNTASASEILAGALQDHDRALIVGEDTFGKGLVQNPFQLEHGSMLLLTIAKYETPSGRLIQRDYSNGELYNYYTEGGSFRDEIKDKPRGVESKTDTGRTVYSGGGINPDIALKPQTITAEKSRVQSKMVVPIFAFSLDLVVGKVRGLEGYKVDKAIAFDYDLKSTDFPITDSVFTAFRQFAVDKYKLSAANIDREREFVERMLRTELVTAAYGIQTSRQVFNEYDQQLLKAIDLMPQARQLASQAEKAKLVKPKTAIN